MKLNKYEWKFIRMMAMTFAMIVAMTIILVLAKVPSKIIKVTFAVMLVLSYLVKRFYWSYLEGLELKEKMDEAVPI